MLPLKTILFVAAIIVGWSIRPASVVVKTGNVRIAVSQVDAKLTYLALGDSYTIGESVDPADRYPVQAVELLRVVDHLDCRAPDLIATTGWTTDNLINAVEAAHPPHNYSLVTLLIGVNNQFQGRTQSEYAEQFTTLLTQSIALAGGKPTHVLVLSIPDYSVTPFARGSNTQIIRSQIDSFNIINRRISVKYDVRYLDITAESRKAAIDPSLIAFDGLHFSGKEYGIWARLMEPMIKALLK